jgi:plastocyanin
MNIKKIIIILAVLLFVVLGIYLITSNKNTNSNKLPVVENTLNKDSQIPIITTSSDVIVDIKNQIFNPTTLDIKTGTKVTWINNDSVANNVTSEMSNLFDSKTLSPGQSFSFTFDKPGFINYSSKLHPTMKGTVIIKD